MSNLAAALKRYQAALDRLETAQSASARAKSAQAKPAQTLSEADILAVLAARDRVQDALKASDAASDNAGDDTDLLTLQLYRLDQKLRSHGTAIASGTRLADWQDSLNIPDSAWWWRFPEPTDPRDRLDWLWSGLTLACLTADVSLITDLSSKFLAGGTDFLGSFAVVSQSVLALLAGGSALTQTGREATERLLQQMGLSKHRWHEAKLVLAAGLLGLLLLLYASLPLLSQLYTSWGQSRQAEGELKTAEQRLQRAVALNPNDAEAHYRLGQVYVDTQNLEGAENQLNLAAKGGMPQAAFDLSRLYIQTERYDRADRVLSEAQSAIAAETGASAGTAALPYDYYLYRGWVSLRQQELQAAAIALDKAIQLDANQAPAHCLLAQVYEQQGNPTARLEWEACLTLADRSDPQQVTWANLAQSKL